jgi:hypothetical protein
MRKEIFVNWKARLFWIAVGILLAWPITHTYHWVAGRNQRREFEALKNLDNLTLRFLENARKGDVSVKRNERGEPVGLIFNLSVNLEAKSSGSEVNLTVRKPGQDEPEGE